eukprot:Awhi_evm1s5084
MFTNRYIGGYSSYGDGTFTTLQSARDQCDTVANCRGITQSSSGTYTLRTSSSVTVSPSGETSWQKGDPSSVSTYDDVIRACKDDVMNIGASGFNIRFDGTACHIKSCLDDLPLYSPNDDDYEVYIWMDSVIHERQFVGLPIEMNVVRLDDLKRIRDYYPNPSSKFGSVSSSTF